MDGRSMPTRGSMGCSLDEVKPKPTIWIVSIDGYDQAFADEAQAKAELKRRIDNMCALRKIDFSLQHIQVQEKDRA
jgi:hypothetical protein